MDKYCFIGVNELREALKEIPDAAMLPVLTYDFLSDCYSLKREMVSKRNVCELGEQAPSIIFSGNDYMTQINIYSVKQKDLCHIEEKGVMKTVMLGNIRTERTENRTHVRKTA